MEKLEPLQAFSFEGNVSYNWKLWLKHFNFYLAATEKDTKGDKRLPFFSHALAKKEEKYMRLLPLNLVIKWN